MYIDIQITITEQRFGRGKFTRREANLSLPDNTTVELGNLAKEMVCDAQEAYLKGGDKQEDKEE